MYAPPDKQNKKKIIKIRNELLKIGIILKSYNLQCNTQSITIYRVVNSLRYFPKQISITTIETQIQSVGFSSFNQTVLNVRYYELKGNLRIINSKKKNIDLIVKINDVFCPLGLVWLLCDFCE